MMATWQKESKFYLPIEFSHKDFSIFYQLQHIPSYCGGMFIHGFGSSYGLESEVNRVQHYYRGSPDALIEFFERMWWDLALKANVWHKDHPADPNTSIGLTVSWWDVDYRPMYWAGENVFNARQGRAVINPNTENRAAYFRTQFGEKRLRDIASKYGLSIPSWEHPTCEYSYSQ